MEFINEESVFSTIPVEPEGVRLDSRERIKLWISFPSCSGFTATRSSPENGNTYITPCFGPVIECILIECPVIPNPFIKMFITDILHRHTFVDIFFHCKKIGSLALSSSLMIIETKSSVRIRNARFNLAAVIDCIQSASSTPFNMTMSSQSRDRLAKSSFFRELNISLNMTCSLVPKLKLEADAFSNEFKCLPNRLIRIINCKDIVACSHVKCV